MKSNAFKKIVFIGLIAFMLIGAISFYFSAPISLLTLDDFALELEDSHDSALSSAIDDPNAWESFNRWQCFKSPQLKIQCNLLNGTFPVPEIVLRNKEKLFVFSLGYEENYNCDDFLNKWQVALQDAKKACFYGAYLPSNGFLVEKQNQSPLFLVSKIKSDRGAWQLR